MNNKTKGQNMAKMNKQVKVKADGVPGRKPRAKDNTGELFPEYARMTTRVRRVRQALKLMKDWNADDFHALQMAFYSGRGDGFGQHETVPGESITDIMRKVYPTSEPASTGPTCNTGCSAEPPSPCDPQE